MTAADHPRFEAPGILADLEAMVGRASPSEDAGRVSALAAWIVERSYTEDPQNGPGRPIGAPPVGLGAFRP